MCSEENKAEHRLYDSHDGREPIVVDVTTLDAFFKNKDCGIDVIKMDIEGAEFGAIQGMTNIIKKNTDLKILTEFWPIGLQMFGSSPTEFLNTLIKYGFNLYHINEREERIEPINVTRLIEMCEGGKDTNLLCKK